MFAESRYDSVLQCGLDFKTCIYNKHKNNVETNPEQQDKVIRITGCDV